MADRAPIFELHILPMFRGIDRLHMLRARPDLDLWSYDAVKQYATAIVGKTSGNTPTMPTADTGGYWPSEWQTLFQRWTTTGFRRLTVPTASGIRIVQSSRPKLTCKVDVPDAPDAVAWFEVVNPDPENRVYRVVVFAGEQYPPPTDTVSVDANESLEDAVAKKGVTVIDASGSHAIAP